MQNIGIFIDYDNIYVTLEKYYETCNNSRLKTNIIQKIKDKFHDDKIILIKAFADFQKINPALTELQKSQVELRHVYSNNNGSIGRKNASDIALTIDIMKSIYTKNFIEKYVIVSSDSDMLPIINELRYFNKDVAIIYSEYGSNNNFENYVDANNRYTVESLLGLSKYNPVKDYEILDQNKLKYILNIINDGITQTFNKYNGKGTSSKKDIYEYLWNTNNFVSNDISLIIECLFSENILVETPIKNSLYYKVLINKDYIKNNEITLTNELIEDYMYK